MKYFFWSIVVIAFMSCILYLPASVAAQAGNPVTFDQVKAALPKLEKYTQDAMAKTGVPGVAIAVVFEDQVVYEKGFGVREAGKQAPIIGDTVFQLASVSKPIASTVVAAVVSDGLVSWDSRISELDPSFQLYEPYPTSQVTVRDLFNHRSGLPGEAGNDLESLGYTRDEILYRLRFMPPASSFRSAYSYSNFGLTEGAVAAVKPTGNSWEQVSREKLYVPLGMTHTSSSYAGFVQEPNRSRLHVKINGVWTAQAKRQPDAQSPAGGVSSTAHDMAQWLRLQLANGKYEGTQFIKPEALDATHAPLFYRGKNPITGRNSFYGLGWGIEFDDQGRAFWAHNGAFSSGARTSVALVPSERLGIVVLSNAFPTGLPEAVSDAFYNFVHKGQAQPDTLDRWEARFALLIAPDDKMRATYGNPPAQPAPALPDSAYVGTYSNNYAGDVYVVAENRGLTLQVGPNKKSLPLTHWDRDVFLSYPFEEAPDAPIPVVFSVGPDGKATQITYELFGVNGQDVASRVSE